MLNKIINMKMRKILKNEKYISLIEFNTKRKSDIISRVKNKKYNVVINYGIVNNLRYVNKFHESVNSTISNGDIYVSCGETLEERRIRVRNKTPRGFKNFIRFVDFIYKRVFPKLPIIKKIYFLITKGHNRVISKAEILGRLYSCGFEIIEYFEYENLFYIISRKISDPDYNLNASYSPIFNMKRVGYEGKIIGVYKLRTMYPFSEYLQDLIIKENKLAKSGKISNDYRITTWGKICRRYWIDELPMIINFFKRDLNIVGVRPISKNYFDRYPLEIQKMRIKIKPGLIPPYYADLPKSFDEVIESERKYLKSRFKKPILTDVKYFYKSFVNIFLKGARSN